MLEKISSFSLSRKLTLIIMLTTVVAMGLSSIAIVLFQEFALSRLLVRELETTADVLGGNSAVALRFKVSKDAERILSSLKAKPNIIGARFYDREKKLFAEYSRDGSLLTIREQSFEEGYKYTLDQVVLIKHIYHDNDFIGFVHIISDLSILYNQLKKTAITTTLIVIACSFLALLLSFKLNRVISRPISNLVSTTDQVSRSKDYSLRATKYSDDDLGKLTEGFNQMLHQIQLRDDDLQKKHNELKESEQRFRELAENIPEVFWITSSDFERMIYVSHTYESIWGRSCESLYKQPKSWIDSVHPDDSEKITVAIEKHIQGKKTFTEEYRIIRPDGSIRWIRNRAFSVPATSGVTDHVVGIAEDITERKKMEEALLKSEKLKSLGTITAGISHEFNNILAIISGNVYLLERTYKEHGGLTEALRTIKRAANDGAEISRRMLKFTKTAKDTAGFVPFDINELINQAIDFTMPRWKNMAQAKGINYCMDTEGMEKIAFISCNPTELREVFINIINNALDAMPDGGTITVATRCVRPPARQAPPFGRVPIRAGNGELGIDSKKENASPPVRQAGERKGDFVEITFADTGKGMPEDVKKKIFDPFFTTKSPEGTGLGMSVTYGIIKKHGGRIDVESEEGKGTTFTLTFPITVETAQQTVLPESDDEMNAKNLRILVVDDEKDICNMLDNILSGDGHKVKVAYGGTEALEILKKEDFDFVLTDLLMPGLSGYDVIKALDELNRRPKVGLMTGWPEKIKTKEKDELKVDFLIKKPFDYVELKKHVNKVIKAG